jgi:leucyl aminopeptidase
MTRAVELALTARPLERVESDIAVAGFFTDERPLRGGAARADWRLCGGLSRRIESGDLSGRSGEALLIGCGRALRAPRLLLLGLGERKDFDPERFGEETGLALDRCLALRCSRVALAPLGIATDDIPRHATALLAGIEDVWRKRNGALTLQLCVPASEIPGVHRALDEARHTVGDLEMNLSLPDGAPSDRR